MHSGGSSRGRKPCRSPSTTADSTSHLPSRNLWKSILLSTSAGRSSRRNCRKFGSKWVVCPSSRFGSSTSLCWCSKLWRFLLRKVRCIWWAWRTCFTRSLPKAKTAWPTMTFSSTWLANWSSWRISSRTLSSRSSLLRTKSRIFCFTTTASKRSTTATT